MSKVVSCEHKLNFRTGKHESKKILEHIHDLRGLEKVPTRGGNYYFLSIVMTFLKMFGYIFKE